MSNFSDLGLSDSLSKVLTELNFETPTKIQQQAIPILLKHANKDFIGLAQTGTGKTAAFGLPLLDAIDPDRRTTQAIVLAPTRELGQQIGQQLEAFSKYLKGVSVQTVYGGASIGPQIKALKKAPQILIATPGRLLDLIKRKAVNLNVVKYVVLDEADEMLNMGFRDDLDDILSHTAGEKATWLFSATMAKEIRGIVKKYMHAPQEVKVDSGTIVNQNIEHQYFITKAKDKPQLLQYIIQLEPDMRGIVFCRTKRDTQQLSEQLQRNGLPVDAIHGDLSQAQRDQVMKRFKNHTLEFLIATDVAARGIDVSDITHVIHYALPDDSEYYTHRSGRTGRAGKQGISLSLVNSSEQRKLKMLEKRLKINFSQYTLPSPVAVENQKLVTWAKRVIDVKTDVKAIEEHKNDIHTLFADLDKQELIDKLLTIELDRFGIKNQDFNADDGEIEKSGSGGRNGHKRLFINVGSIDGYNKKELIDLICEQSGIPKEAVGPVTMEERRTYVEVKSDASKIVEAAFKGMMIDGREIRVNSADNKRRGGSRNFKSHHQKDRKRGRKGRRR